MLRTLVAALLAAAFTIVVPQIAYADEGEGSTNDYENVGNEDTTIPPDSGNESGAGNKPACEFQGNFDDICIGTSACWVNDPAAVQEPEELEGVPRPSPEDHVIYVSCVRPSGEEWDQWYWSSQWETESVLDRMWTARGRLQIPGFAAQFNPPRRTLVNVETWFASPGMPTTEVVGSSAAGLVAIGTPRGMTVNPGDGSAALSCPITTSPSEACMHPYKRARPAGYTATISLTYDIRYELNGQVIDIPPGAPADLVSVQISDEVTVPVFEIQSVVNGVG